MPCPARCPGRPAFRCLFLPALALVAFAVAFGAAARPATANEKYAAIVVDATTGDTLFARQADATRYPASLTKIMTLYVLFEEIEAGRISLDTPLPVSTYASQRPPSKIGFKPGQTIKAEDAIRVLVTKSANDVAVVVAEAISGSEAAFAARMTKTARRLGMPATTFKNASGLPHPQQKTTARDMARLGIAIQERFPRLYAFFQLKSASYRGRSYRNHNRLLGAVAGVDGIKTGYIRASGFNLVSSVRRDGRHIVAVVMGGRTGASRNAHMTELIDAHIKKASVGGVRRLYALSAVDEHFRKPPIPRAKPYAVVLASVIERSMLSGPEWQVASTSLVDDFASVRPQSSNGPARLAAGSAGAAGTAGRVAHVAQAGAPRQRRTNPAPAITADTRRPVAADTRRPVAAGAIAAASLGGRGPRTETRDEADAGRLAYTNDAFDRIFSQMPEIEIEIGSGEDPEEIAEETGAANDPIADDPGGRVDVALGAPPPAGWHIQLGAVESPEEASSLLAQAKGTFPQILGDRDPYLMTVESAGVTLYRARFVGFASQRDAQAACGRLQKAKQPCWAEAM